MEYNKFTIEEKEEFLINHGWRTLWTENNWLNSSDFENPEICEGLTLNEAFNECVESVEAEEIFKKHGFIDWNKLSIDDMVKHLVKEYEFQSTGTAKAIFTLIDFYENYKNRDEEMLNYFLNDLRRCTEDDNGNIMLNGMSTKEIVDNFLESSEYEHFKSKFKNF